MSCPDCTLSLMIVAPTPAPWIVIPFVTPNVRVQLVLPAGIVTVSPSAAEAMAAATSDCDALLALIVVVVAAVRSEVVRTRVAASETRAETCGVGMVGRRRFRTGLGFVGIYQFAALFRALDPIGCVGAGKEDSWVVRSYEVEGKPERT